MDDLAVGVAVVVAVAVGVVVVVGVAVGVVVAVAVGVVVAVVVAVAVGEDTWGDRRHCICGVGECPVLTGGDA